MNWQLIKRIAFKIPFQLPYLFSYLLLSIVYYSHYCKWRKNLFAPIYKDKYEMFSVLNKGAVRYYEFGFGKSFYCWLENNKHQFSEFYGYDTFEGLPERWGVYDKGEMRTEVPIINDNRVILFKGLFQDTYEPIESIGNNVIVFLDCDLYPSMTYVLNIIKWKSDDIIIFDDFNVMPEGFRAFYDWATSTKIIYEVIGRTINNSEIAIKIKKEK